MDQVKVIKAKAARADKPLKDLASELRKGIVEIIGSSPQRVVILAEDLAHLVAYGNQMNYIANELDGLLPQPISIIVKEGYVRKEGDYVIDFKAVRNGFSVLPNPNPARV